MAPLAFYTSKKTKIQITGQTYFTVFHMTTTAASCRSSESEVKARS